MKKLMGLALIALSMSSGCGVKPDSKEPPVSQQSAEIAVNADSLKAIVRTCDLPAPAPSPAPETSSDVPDIGFPPGDPNAIQDHFGPTGIAVPGRCPPTQEQVNAQVASRGGVRTGRDLESRIQRFEITLVSIQDLKCPASSTTLLGRLNSLTGLRGNPNVNGILQTLGFNQTPAG